MKPGDEEKIGKLLRGSQSRSLGKILLKNADLSEEEKSEILNANPPFGVRKVGPGLREILRNPPTPYSGITKEDIEQIKESWFERIKKK